MCSREVIKEAFAMHEYGRGREREYVQYVRGVCRFDYLPPTLNPPPQPAFALLC